MATIPVLVPSEPLGSPVVLWDIRHEREVFTPQRLAEFLHNVSQDLDKYSFEN